MADAIDSEKMLASCAELFVQEECPYIAHVCGCLESMNSSLTSQAILVCAALEAVLQCLSADNQAAEVPASEDQEKLMAYLNQIEASKAFVDRITGFLTAMGSVRPKDILIRWIDRSLLEVSQEDLQAWQKVRHCVAHGGLMTLDNDAIQALSRLKNLFNKCVLQAAGYEGKFMDYVTWSHREFPLADNSNL